MGWCSTHFAFKQFGDKTMKKETNEAEPVPRIFKGKAAFFRVAHSHRLTESHLSEFFSYVSLHGCVVRMTPQSLPVQAATFPVPNSRSITAIYNR